MCPGLEGRGRGRRLSTVGIHRSLYLIRGLVVDVKEISTPSRERRHPTRQGHEGGRSVDSPDGGRDRCRAKIRARGFLHPSQDRYCCFWPWGILADQRSSPCGGSGAASPDAAAGNRGPSFGYGRYDLKQRPVDWSAGSSRQPIWRHTTLTIVIDSPLCESSTFPMASAAAGTPKKLQGDG